MPERVLDDEDLAACLRVLAAIVEDRAVLGELEPERRRELVILAGRASRPDRADVKKVAKALRAREREERKARHRAMLDRTGIRTLRRAPVFETPLLPPEIVSIGSAQNQEAADDPRKCYVCKTAFRSVHFFYDQMCTACAELNWHKRNQSTDLSGRVALVTGARVKIGYQAAIKLLRAGARVLVTTRFARDAAERFAREGDFEAWRERLAIYGLDLRHTPSVEIFARHLLERESRLDFVLHNACQTVRRPPGFYAHLVDRELEARDAMVPSARALLARYDSLRAGAVELARGLLAPSLLTQTPLTTEDRALGADIGLFPSGALDQDLQQIDLRTHNSWRLSLEQVPTIELLEVQLVNAVAPFVLSSRLKPLLCRAASRDKHIVNVSAMEGQFYRAHKTDKHPHTNMAKAALNMLTRTSAADYVRDGIHMNSVDTGWVTDEDPAHLASRKREVHGFHPPLDIVDGAARICDPIFAGFATGEHAWGKFFKDYKETPW